MSTYTAYIQVDPLDVFETAFRALEGDGSTAYLAVVTQHDAALWILKAFRDKGWEIVQRSA